MTGEAAVAGDIQDLIDQARGNEEGRLAVLSQAAELAAKSGLDRLEAAARHDLGRALRRSGGRRDEEALRELNRALELQVGIGDPHGQIATLLELGLHSFQCSDLATAIPLLHEAARLCRITGQLPELADAYDILAGVYATMGDSASALEYCQLQLDLATRLGDRRRLVHAHDAIASTLAEVGRPAEAGRHFEAGRAAIADLEGVPSTERGFLDAVLVVDWAEALSRSDDLPTALLKAREGVELAARTGNAGLHGQSLYCLGHILCRLGEAAEAEAALVRAGELYAHVRNKYYRGKIERELAGLYKAQGRHAEALACLEQAVAIDSALRRDAAMHQSAQQKGLERIESLRREKDAAERVVLSVLPDAVARRMLRGTGRIAEQVGDVSVLFADVVGFTVLASRIGPADLLALLDRIFTEFDALTEAAGLTKIKTIGDAYMVAGGVPDAMPDHVEKCARLALAMLGALSAMNTASGAGLSLRIGIHAGPAIAGVIGTTRLSYDLWGETVNLASRLESSGVPGRIQVSRAVRDRLHSTFSFRSRGMVNLKGVGETGTYFLDGPLL